MFLNLQMLSWVLSQSVCFSFILLSHSFKHIEHTYFIFQYLLLELSSIYSSCHVWHLVSFACACLHWSRNSPERICICFCYWWEGAAHLPPLFICNHFNFSTWDFLDHRGQCGFGSEACMQSSWSFSILGRDCFRETASLLFLSAWWGLFHIPLPLES